MMIVIPIQIDRPQSAIAVSKANQLRDAFIKIAIETLGADWIVTAAGDDSVIRCFPRTDIATGSRTNGAGGHPISSLIPAND